jgi:kinesin family member C1
MRTEKEEMKLKASELEFAAEQTRRLHEGALDDLQRKQRHQLDDLLEQHRREIDRLNRAAADDTEAVRKQAKEEANTMLRSHQQALTDLERQLGLEIEEERVGACSVPLLIVLLTSHCRTVEPVKSKN